MFYHLKIEFVTRTNGRVHQRAFESSREGLKPYVIRFFHFSFFGHVEKNIHDTPSADATFFFRFQCFFSEKTFHFFDSPASKFWTLRASLTS